tara:strand:+ start:2442 stop:2729 length:288 start_codon:yes stop_codon:yes gene_type:complete
MEINEAKNIVKSIYLQAAALGGFEVNPESPEVLVELVQEGFERVNPERRAEAAANIIDVISMALRITEQNNKTIMDEQSIDDAKEKICPVYPFGR